MPKIRGAHVAPCPRRVSTSALKHYMKAKDMGNLHLSHCSGVTKSTVNRIVCGDHRYPRIHTLDRIAVTLGVPIEYLLEFDI